MAEFFSFLQTFVICGTVFFITTLVLLALPQSRLRSVGLEISRYALAAGLLLLIPSPIDPVPDVVPVIGWLDDIGYLVGACYAISSALGERKNRALFEECEREELRARTATLKQLNDASGNGSPAVEETREASRKEVVA
jgi:uncharacterized membrane protein YkvA (DUF1232 family)